MLAIADERRREPRAARREDAERHADRHRRRASRPATSSDVLAEQRRQLGAVRRARTRTAASSRDPPADRRGIGGTRRAASARAGRASRRSRAACRTRSAARHRGRRSRSASANASRHVVRDDAAPSCAAASWMRRNSRVQLGARDRIERAERLVHQQHRRIDGERARDADALPLAARQLVGPARGERVAGEADQLEQFADARGDAIGGPAFEARHDARRCRRRSCAGTGRRPAARSRRARRRRIGSHSRVSRPSTNDRARVGQQQPVDELEERRLAGAAAPDQRDDLARLNDRSKRSSTRCAARAREGHVPELDGRHA